MTKRIQSAFDYVEYRLVLNDDFLARSSTNLSYSLRAYARDLDLSPSFISDILRGRRDLSSRNSRDVFEKLGFEVGEIDYLQSLVQLKQTKDPLEKQNILQAIQARHTPGTYLRDATKDLIMKSVDHFLMHGLIGAEGQRDAVLSLALKAGISGERATEVIDELVGGGYVRRENDNLLIENLNLYIPDHSRIFDIQRQFVNRLIDLTVATGGNRMPEQMGHYLVMGFDRDTFPLVTEAYKHLINSLNRLSNQTPVAERYAFFSSSFYSFTK